MKKLLLSMLAFVTVTVHGGPYYVYYNEPYNG